MRIGIDSKYILDKYASGKLSGFVGQTASDKFIVEVQEESGRVVFMKQAKSLFSAKATLRDFILNKAKQYKKAFNYKNHMKQAQVHGHGQAFLPDGLSTSTSPLVNAKPQFGSRWRNPLSRGNGGGKGSDLRGGDFSGQGDKKHWRGMYDDGFDPMDPQQKWTQQKIRDMRKQRKGDETMYIVKDLTTGEESQPLSWYEAMKYRNKKCPGGMVFPLVSGERTINPV